MEWQPIETAPKDGTEILLWSDYANICTWCIVGYKKNTPVYGWGIVWSDSPIEMQNVTHWMPIIGPK